MAAKKPKKPPTPYKSEYCEQARKLALLNATELQMADFLGVSHKTLYRWKQAHKEFATAIQEGKAPADGNVARSLYERTQGYIIREQKPIKIRGKDGREYIEIVDVERELPPETVACIFWLKNRQRDLWKDVHRKEHAGPDGGPLTVNVKIIR